MTIFTSVLLCECGLHTLAPSLDIQEAGGSEVSSYRSPWMGRLSFSYSLCSLKPSSAERNVLAAKKKIKTFPEFEGENSVP